MVIARYVLGSSELKNLTVFVRANGNAPLLLPLLFATFLAKNGFVYRQRRDQHGGVNFEPVYVRDNTAQNYLSCLHLFLDTLEAYAASSPDTQPLTPSSDNFGLVDQSLLATYLNEYLPQHCGTFRTLQLHRAALQAFFDWLAFFDLRDAVQLALRRDAADLLAEPSKSKEGVVQYVSRDFRRLLMLACRNMRDRLIIRCGFELGLRASENLALVLPDQKIGTAKKPGLLKLFSLAGSDNESGAFEYWLNGRHCKGGKSRPIMIPASLLRDMANYFDTERRGFLSSTGSNCPHLFINYGRSSKVPISRQLPTDIFRALRSEIPHMDQGLTYQDLRHTFATELYAMVTADNTVSDNGRALTLVQDCLGHSSPNSTRIYVHLFEKMQVIESSDRLLPTVHEN